MTPLSVAVFTVVPSPYQRDLFRAMQDRADLDLQVFYLEDAAPDSPWPKAELLDWETVLPGRSLGKGRVRTHFHFNIPDSSGFDIAIVNTALTAVTTQLLMRHTLQHMPWIFWGEVLSQHENPARRAVQAAFASPLTRANSLVAIGQRAVSDYQKRFPNQTVHRLPYFCDLQEFSAAATGTDQRPEPVFLFCGQIIERKGVDLLLEAFSTVIRSGTGAQLLLAGREGELDRFLEPLAPEVRQHIEYIGFVEPKELPELFAKADVFVLPSRHDGWGVVVNQAIGAGLPIIATDAVGAALDLINDGENGFLVPAGQAEPLAAAMQKLAAHPELRENFAASNQQRAIELDPSSGAERWSAILHQSIQ